MPAIPAVYLGFIEKLGASVGVILFLIVANRAAGSLFSRRIRDRAQSHTLRMLLRDSSFFAGAVVVVVIWLGLGPHLTVAMGVLGAGIAFASQEVIGSFAGYLNIVIGGLFRIGDRVRIGDVAGDVLDISILRTTVMEIGEWVKADQYTGRIVTVANGIIFSSSLYNYTQNWPYLWDEILIPVTYASDWKRAAEIMLEHGSQYTARFQNEAEAELGQLMKRYPVHPSPVTPTIYTTMTDNWIEIVLRYIVDARERRTVRGQLHQELLEHFQGEPDITVASATFEIVGFPPLRGDASAADTVP